MLEDIENIETRPQPKYVLLTYAEYMKLNHDLSVAKGWQLGQQTERSRGMKPPTAKVNVQTDAEGNETSYDIKYVLKVTSKEQEDYPDIISGFELHDSYVPVDITEQVIEGEIETDVIDWTMNHCEKQGIATTELVMYIAGKDVVDFPTIPVEGEWCKAKIYAYDTDKAKCIQPHTRTHRTPEEEPALWTVIKTVSSYEDVEDWNGSNYLAYQTVGYLVKYNNKIWASKLPISHTWIAPTLTGDGAISWKFVADV